MPQAVAAVGFALFQAGVPLGLVNAVTLGGIAALSYAGQAILYSGLTIGANALINAGRASASPALNSPEVRGNIRQSVPTQRVVYGACRIGGALFYQNDTAPPYLYVGVLLSSRRISAITGTLVGQAPVAFLSDGAASTALYSGRLWRSIRDGDPDQTVDPLILADFPATPATFRQRGHAAAVLKFHYGSSGDEFLKLWGNVQIPNVLFDVEGAPVYDPRDPTQRMWEDPADIEDVNDAMATWKYSNTASLVQADYLVQPYGGRQHPSVMRWDKIADSADFDDELVGLKDGGFQKRFTIDGVILKSQPRDQVMQGMLTANRGFIAQSRGQVWPTSSRPSAPVMTIHEGVMVGGFQFRASAPKAALVNKVRSRFIAPDREFNLSDGPLRIRTDYETADGETLEQTLQLSFTSTHQRAQRLAKAFLEQSRIGRTLTCTIRLSAGLGLEAGDCVRVASNYYSQMNGLYQVAQAGFAEDSSVIALSLTEYDPGISGRWDPQEDEQPFVIAPTDSDDE